MISTISLLPLGTNAGVLNTPPQQLLSYLMEFRCGDTSYQLLFDVASKHVSDPKYVDPERLEAVFISHAHLDHTLRLGSLIKLLKKHKRTRTLKIYAQYHAWKQIKRLISLICGKIPSFVSYVPTDIEMGEPHLKSHTKISTNDYNQIKTLPPLELNPELNIQIKVAPSKHSKNSVAYRLKIDNYLDLVFCPDTSYTSDHLIPFFKDTTFCLLDAAFTKEEIDDLYEKYLKNQRKGEIVCHSSPYYSGRLCEAAGAKNYVIIHYVWTRFAKIYSEFERNIVERAKETYSGNIILSKELEPIQIYPVKNE